jgi:hypothetical protein
MLIKQLVVLQLVKMMMKEMFLHFVKRKKRNQQIVMQQERLVKGIFK